MDTLCVLLIFISLKIGQKYKKNIYFCGLKMNIYNKN